MSYEGLDGISTPKPQKTKQLVDQNFINAYKKAIKAIDFIMTHQKDFEKAYGRKGTYKVIEGYKVMKSQLNETINGRKVNASDEERNIVDVTLKVLGEVLAFREVNNFVRDLTIHLAKLSINWAELCADGCANMKLYASLLMRIAQQNMTIIDYINVSKRMIQRLESTFLQRPAAFISSEHYKKALQKASEK